MFAAGARSLRRSEAFRSHGPPSGDCPGVLLEQNSSGGSFGAAVVHGQAALLHSFTARATKTRRTLSVQ